MSAGRHRPMLPPETPGHSQASLGQSLVETLLFSPVSWLVRTRFCLYLWESVSPVLCKFWLLYGGVNGDLLQEGLCRTQVCCTQSPALRQPTADPHLHRRCSNTVLAQSLRPGVHKVCLSSPSGSGGHAIPPLQPSCWGFSFALRHGVSLFDGIQHSPVNSCWTASCNFGVLAGEDELISYITQLNGNNHKFLLFFIVSNASYKIHIFIWMTSS